MSRDAALQRVARPAFKRDMSERAFARSCARHGFSHVPEKNPDVLVFASLDGALRVHGVMRQQNGLLRLYRRDTVRLMFAARMAAGDKKAAGASTPAAPIDQSLTGE